jgi:hypothetical protein
MVNYFFDPRDKSTVPCKFLSNFCTNRTIYEGIEHWAIVTYGIMFFLDNPNFRKS